MRKFSTQSIRGDPTLSMTMDSQGRNTLSNTPSSHSNKERSRKSSVLTLINTDGVKDPLRLRKFSISFVQGSSREHRTIRLNRLLNIETGIDVNR